ncbi:hypothetical protein Q6375_05705 [Clostridium septicum]|uniref:hypothetical protein n=1 Tax=Clostridium septicum TaxID=1504 RepID=UPI00272E47E4|nr:hypothetical protein [Clostridium septicum]WLF70483.1 hypothetical protein Q6375_05705 [Clostridium septicum]
MGLFSKKNKERCVTLKHINGLEIYPENLIVNLTLKEDLLEIKSKNVSNVPDIKLPYVQILSADCITEREIVKESKNVVGRAVVGGILLGPLGSIVGGMSGVGDKTHSAPKYFIVINYKNKKEELKVLSFEVVGFSIWSKFIKELKNNIVNNANCESNEELYL